MYPNDEQGHGHDAPNVCIPTSVNLHRYISTSLTLNQAFSVFRNQRILEQGQADSIKSTGLTHLAGWVYVAAKPSTVQAIALTAIHRLPHARSPLEGPLTSAKLLISKLR